MAIVNKGFRRKREVEAPQDRVPPGQYVTSDFPVLSAGPTPMVDRNEWRLFVTTAVGDERSWTWSEFQQLPAEDVTVDIHCVTKWSKLGTRWQGVSVDTILGEIDTAAEFVVAFSD